MLFQLRCGYRQLRQNIEFQRNLNQQEAKVERRRGSRRQIGKRSHLHAVQAQLRLAAGIFANGITFEFFKEQC